MSSYRQTDRSRNQDASPRQAWADNRRSTDTSNSAGDYAGSSSARSQRDYDDVSQAGDQHHNMDIDEPVSSIRPLQMLEKTVALFEALDNLKPLVGTSREEINRVTARLGHRKDYGDKAMEELKDNYEKMERQNAELKMQLGEKNNQLQDMHKDRCSNTNSTAKISRLEEELRKVTDTKESYRTKCKEAYLKYKQANDRIEELEEVIKRGKTGLSSMGQECESLRTKLSLSQDQCRQLAERTKKMEVELSDCKTRLSSSLGSKITDNNPNIADLSDQNRPTKLGERFSELYDNEWTDAFEVFEKRYKDEQKSVGALVQILQDIKRHCDNMARDQVKILQAAISLGHTRDEWPDHVFKQLKDFRKVIVRASFPEVLQKYQTDNRHSTNTLVSDGRVQSFVKECVELCWLMSVQDPPVAFGPTPNNLDNFDTNAYKFYTQSGPTVAYVVWPALHLHEGGPMLSKGVAQGCGTSQSKSARESSRDSSRITSSTSHSSSGRPQTAPPVQAMDRNVKGTQHEEYDNASPVDYEQNVQHYHKSDQQSAVRDKKPTTSTLQGISRTAKETESTDRLKQHTGGSQRPMDLPEKHVFKQFREYILTHGIKNYKTQKEFGENYEKCLAYYKWLYGYY